MSHLLELRDRLMRAGGAVLVLFIMAAPFANTLYEYLAQPLMSALPEGNSMISTEPHGPFFVPFKFAFAFATAVAMPYLLYQLWAFVAPGLYEHEKKLTVPLLVSSSVLFYLGILFAYFVVFPVIFAFFTSTAPDGVLVMTDISAYLSFVLKLFFAFGLAFEVPVATVLLVRMGMTTPDALATKRPYIIVGAFVVGMLMTPPDIFVFVRSSQRVRKRFQLHITEPDVRIGHKMIRIHRYVLRRTNISINTQSTVSTR